MGETKTENRDELIRGHLLVEIDQRGKFQPCHKHHFLGELVAIFMAGDWGVRADCPLPTRQVIMCSKVGREGPIGNTH